jgi:hypothetical protein
MTISILHTMASQDKRDPDEKLTSGRGPEYAASLVIVVNKMKMRVDQLEKSSVLDVSDKEGKDIIGIRSKVQVYKSRFAQPNTTVKVQVPYPEGLDPYSGLFDLMKDLGEISSPSLGWYSFTREDNSVVKFREKEFRSHADEIMALSDSGKLKVTIVEPKKDSGEEEE